MADAPLLGVPELVARKRDGGELSADELASCVGGYLDGSVGEGQMAALLMAGVLRGFSDAEARALTRILVDSGEILDLSGLPGPTVDKHSTGGVSDGTTLLVAPLLAAAGVQVVKLSGRGLGHTGGTLDKLESIPGFRVDLAPDEMLRIAGAVGCVVAAQSERLVPADKALYALRDVTGTVPSPALIAASVMSKKIAAGAGTIVLDVKTGNGAFMQSLDSAVTLARLCVDIGVAAGRRCVAFVTAMDQPLGTSVGNALEIAEGIELLGRPAGGRLADVALTLATGALVALGESEDDARRRLVDLWASGAALERLAQMVGAQGGDPAVCQRPREVLPTAPVTLPVTAPRDGWVTALPARGIGELAAALGAGRARAGDRVDPAVGLQLHVEVGSAVAARQPVATVYARNSERGEAVADRLAGLVGYGDQAPPPAPVVLQTVTG